MTYHPLTITSLQYVADVSVTDPDTGEKVDLVVFKDPVSGGMLGLDFSYLDHTNQDLIPSPFDPTVRFRLDDDNPS